LLPGPNFIKEKGIKWQLQPNYLGGRRGFGIFKESCPMERVLEVPTKLLWGSNFVKKNGIKWWIMREKSIFPMEKGTKW
jgi:hypothetical protein